MNTILAIDDEFDILILIEAILKRNGFKVEKLSQTHELLQKVEAINPDLILLDINMGEVDGKVICKQLKAETPYKVVLCSANTDLNIMSDECGADGFINKPFTINDLLRKINSVVTINAA